MKQLENLRWRPAWTTHMGCLHACLEYLGVEVTMPWLFGATSHAFVINIHDAICPSGPTAWKSIAIHVLGSKLGYQVDHALGFGQDLPAAQERAFEMVRSSIDQGRPCFGWELEVPEYYVIHGYDDVGYHYSGPGCDDGKGPKPWRELGDTGIGVLEVYAIGPGPPAPDDEVVRCALKSALAHAEPAGDATDKVAVQALLNGTIEHVPSGWAFEKYTMGPRAFDVWADALESGTASRFGQGYNAAVWEECRGMAAAFLREAKERLPGTADDLFEQAAQHYRQVHASLAGLLALFPFSHEPEEERVKDPEAAELVRDAGQAERRALDVLGEIVARLE